MRGLKLVSRDYQRENTVVKVGSAAVGSGQKMFMAGPCAVESLGQITGIAEQIKDYTHILRGGAYKPRTSPYSFQGLEEEGLGFLRDAGRAAGLPVVTEVVAPEDVDLVGSYADLLQIGARNMHNYPLLKRVGSQAKPVLLKRGFGATLEELLFSAEYILAFGNSQVILCERGIRTFNKHTSSTLDLGAVPVLQQLTHLPVIVDPSHGTGRWDLVQPLALAALAAGADGLMIEVHDQPEKALSDGPQALKPEKYKTLIKTARRLVQCLGGWEQ
ncbi:MAG: 3-deoxy-7-phosphoheptulonate synthase [Firmicutes bacterium]|nr:3-deoxy-7-phosphoheptulonate synthase [Bacillota bacterium]